MSESVGEHFKFPVVSHFEMTIVKDVIVFLLSILVEDLHVPLQHQIDQASLSMFSFFLGGP